MQKGLAHLFIIIAVVISLVFILFSTNNNQEDKRKYSSENISDSDIPNNLSLPFRIADLSTSSGIINPLGIIRTDRDKGHGHGGIDFPLRPGSKVSAVADGEIVEISKVSSLEGDEKLVVLLEKTTSGEGWVFIYEHLLLNDSLKVGDLVQRGDELATHVLDQRTSHYQLSLSFNEYKYYQEGQCWPNYLSKSDEVELKDFFDTYKNLDHSLGVWSSANEDGHYSFLALLDEKKYPEGVRLCYPDKTDARIPL